MKTKVITALFIFSLIPHTAYSFDKCSALFADDKVGVQQVASDALDTDLAFRKQDKVARTDEHSIRTGKAAAHIYADSGKQDAPYSFFGFPSGNSGVAIWFKSKFANASLEAKSPPRALQDQNGMNGAEVDFKSGTKQLQIGDTLLGSMRFIRDRELGRDIFAQSVGKMYRWIANSKVTVENGKLIYTRRGINMLSRYRMEIQPLPGTRLQKTVGGSFELVSDSEVQFTMRGLTSEKPLTPISLKAAFKDGVFETMDPHRLIELSFLWYKEKMMAGSPRYFSKFGRDSIYFLNVLMDSLKPEAIEGLLTATLNSVDPVSGQVSHEQHEGDFVSFVLAKSKQAYKYLTGVLEDDKMLDDNPALMANLGRYRAQYPERWADFVEGVDDRGIKRGDLIKKLHGLLEKQAAPFAEAVAKIRANNPGELTSAEKLQLKKLLIRLHDNEPTGQWRDSNLGLGNGIVAFDVNTVFLPAALKAMADLAADPGPNAKPNPFYDAAKAVELKKTYEAWNREVVPLFEVKVKKEELRAYAETFYKNSSRDLNTLPPTPNEDIVFSAISLDANFEPVRVMHSDDSLMMTFGTPSEAHLQTISQRVRLPFPYGLKTDMGFLIANPVFAPADIQAIFTDKNYHGTVVWTMQEDMMVIGMARQYMRRDISGKAKKRLHEDTDMMEKVLHDRVDLGGIEVFAISFDKAQGKWTYVPFNGDAKGNSNQLWGHLRLVIPKMIKNMKSAAAEAAKRSA